MTKPEPTLSELARDAWLAATHDAVELAIRTGTPVVTQWEGRVQEVDLRAVQATLPPRPVPRFPAG